MAATTASDSFGKLYSKRIQFHIDAVKALPLPKRSHKAPTAYVSVKISDIKDHLRTSVVKGQNATWQENLSPTRINENSEIVFEVKHRSIWPKPTTSRLAVTDPYSLSTLLQMQGGNTFGTNIELPLHAAIETHASGKRVAGSLSVNIRELTSIETAKLCCEMAERRSSELQKIESNQIGHIAPEIQITPEHSTA
ncbi:C2 domain-containing protein [Mycena venus]|uniref:C2 domain-containing protein n=1 Tax=Mycena venus TaxID=2733690 RepID=A0A8H7D649_9AGAR|nr:C2 domain-containing protein [Mycena venus]